MQLFARIRRSEPDLPFCALIAFVLAGLVFALQGHVGFGMQDESFLWYGVQRTHAGEVPLRDFRSYDPGRYYWCAAWATIFGDGLVAVRAASWIFAALGLTCGLLAARRVMKSRWLSLVLGLLLVSWMSPPWKLFESSLSMAAVLFATRLVEQPTRARHLAAGFLVGIAAFFGRNWGLYTALAFAAATILIAWKQRAPNFIARSAAFCGGVLAGYSPMMLLCLVAPGFGTAFVDSVRFYLGQNALNAELPFPWPWRSIHAGMSFMQTASALSIGVCFILLFAFPLVAWVVIARTNVESLAKRALLVGSVVVGTFSMHHASVRSDVPHLAQSIHPMLIGMLALPSALARATSRISIACVLLGLLALTAFAIVPSSPAFRRWTSDPPHDYVTTRIGADEIMLARNEAASVETMCALIARNVLPDQKIWFGAHFIGLYPLLGRHSPVWDIYPAWKASDAVQERMQAELAVVDWVLLDLRPIGGDASMTLPVSHPLVWQALQKDFERILVPGAPGSLVFLRRKRA